MLRHQVRPPRRRSPAVGYLGSCQLSACAAFGRGWKQLSSASLKPPEAPTGEVQPCHRTPLGATSRDNSRQVARRCSIWQGLEAAWTCQPAAEPTSSFKFQHSGSGLAYRFVLRLLRCGQVLCNEEGVPIREMRDDDVAARELTLDSKMRAFFRLSNFSHRCRLQLSTSFCHALNRHTPFAKAAPQHHLTRMEGYRIVNESGAAQDRSPVSTRAKRCPRMSYEEVSG